MNRAFILCLFSFFVNTLCSQNILRHPVFLHDTIEGYGHLFFNHAPQILFLKNGLELPNNNVLINSRIIVSAYGGVQEAFEDQNIWYACSDDEGNTWSEPDSLLIGEEHAGMKTVFNGSLFLAPDNSIIQFILFQNGPGGGASGQYPIFLKYKLSYDGGISWSDIFEPEINGVEDTSLFRIIGPFCKPVEIHPDTMGFPLYYRYVGNPTAYFGFLKVSKDLQKFELKKFPSISLPHPDRLIEPVSVYQNSTIFTYFRTSTGKVWYYTSADKGTSWHGPFHLQVPHPGTLFNAFLFEDKQFLVTNLSTQRREQLSLIRIDPINQTPPSFLHRIDNIDATYYQVTYPSIDTSHPSSVLISYSAIGYHLEKGRFGDIFFASISKDSIRAWTQNNTVQFDQKGGLKDSLTLDFILVNSATDLADNIYVSDLHGKVYSISYTGQDYAIITSPDASSFYSQILSKEDSIILSSSGGWKKTHFSEINWADGPFNGANNFRAIEFDNSGNSFLLHNNLILKYFENSTFVREANLRELGIPISDYQYISEVNCDKETGEILVLTNLGKMFVSHDTLTSLTPSSVISPLWPTVTIRWNNSWLCGNTLGQCYILEDGGDSWRLVHSNPGAFPVQQLLKTQDSLLILYSNGYALLDGNFSQITLVNFDPSSTSLTRVHTTNDSLLFVDALGTTFKKPMRMNLTSADPFRHKEVNKYSLFPNPTSGFIYFGQPPPSSCEIWSSSGMLLKQIDKPAGWIDLQSYQSGLYYIKATWKGKPIIFKIIKI